MLIVGQDRHQCEHGKIRKQTEIHVSNISNGRNYIGIHENIFSSWEIWPRREVNATYHCRCFLAIRENWTHFHLFPSRSNAPIKGTLWLILKCLKASLRTKLRKGHMIGNEYPEDHSILERQIRTKFLLEFSCHTDGVIPRECRFILWYDSFSVICRGTWVKVLLSPEQSNKTAAIAVL